jgi:hypothetical protein
MARRIGRSAAAMVGALSVAVGAVLGGSGLMGRDPLRMPTQAASSVELMATALIMGGTNQTISIGPSTPAFIAHFVAENFADFIAPTGLCKPGCDLTAVYTPEQMRPFTGFASMPLDESVEAGRVNLDACIRGLPCTITTYPYIATAVQSLTDTSFVVNGGSQSAAISSVEKSYLIAHPVPGATISFVLVSNVNRPNGGLLERFVGAYIPFIGIDFNGATPTNSPATNPLTTVDISRQYDAWSDFPLNPLNLLADLNALLGAGYLHSHYDEMDSPFLLQGLFQDSSYFLYPTDLLPLLMPLGEIPVLGMPLAKALDAPLRVLVETGYNRTINPGQPTPAQWLYFPDPIKTLVDFAVAIPTGWDDAIAYVTGDPLNRPFHTAPQGVYGVGGPPVFAGAVDPYAPLPQSQQSAAAVTAGSVSEPTPGSATPVASSRAATVAARSVRLSESTRPAAATTSPSTVRAKPRTAAARADGASAGGTRAASARASVGKH